jgi:hypothetical protein
LHPAQAATDHRSELRDAQRVAQPGLRVDPVFDGDHRKVSAVGLLGGGIGVRRARRAKTRARVVHADHEEALGVQRLARAHQVVPPAGAFRVAFVDTRNVVAGVERVAHQHRIRACFVERAVGLVHQLVVAQHRAAAQRQGLRKRHRLWSDVSQRIHQASKLSVAGRKAAQSGFK